MKKKTLDQYLKESPDVDYRDIAKRLRRMVKKDFGTCKLTDFSLGCASCAANRCAQLVEELAEYIKVLDMK